MRLQGGIDSSNGCAEICKFGTGELCVVMCGMTVMPEFYVDTLNTTLKVCMIMSVRQYILQVSDCMKLLEV